MRRVMKCFCIFHADKKKEHFSGGGMRFYDLSIFQV